jgi:hypothetical protein
MPNPEPIFFPNYQNPNRVPGGTDEIKPIGGMTLRDYFAAMALAGILGNPGQATPDGEWDRFATAAYEAAGAMLTARLDRIKVKENELQNVIQETLATASKFIGDEQGGHIEFAGKVWRPTDETVQA